MQVFSRVGILAEEAIFKENSRNLSWNNFSSADLRIGTIEAFCEDKNELLDRIHKCVMLIDLGVLGKQYCIGLLDKNLSRADLIGKQVLVLVNLHPEDIQRYFSIENASAVLCTIAGKAILEPAKPVANSFRLA